jgi:hypothetical protein
MKNQPEKKLTLSQVVQGYSARVFVYADEAAEKAGIKTYTGVQKALYTDFELAKIATKLMGRNNPYTEDAVQKAREKLHIKPSTGFGGARPGAGRPRGSENKHSSSQPTVRRMHNLSIGTAALVQACMSSYECKHESEDSFDYCKNIYTKHEVWRYTGGATRPYDLPSRYSPAPMAIMGRSGSLRRPGQ